MAVIYQYGFFVLIGIVIGVWITIKWIAPPDDDIHIGKIKIKGRGHNVSDIVDVEVQPDKKRKRLRDRIKERRSQK